MSKGVFNDISNEELEKLLTDCGLNFKKVQPGNGGIFIGPEETNIRDLEHQYHQNTKDIAEMILGLSEGYKRLENIIYQSNIDNTFDENEEYFLKAA